MYSTNVVTDESVHVEIQKTGPGNIIVGTLYQGKQIQTVSGSSDSGPYEIGTQDLSIKDSGYNILDLSTMHSGQDPNNLFPYNSNTF